MSACTEFRPPFHVCATASQLSYWRIEITSENRKPIADKGQETPGLGQTEENPRPNLLSWGFSSGLFILAGCCSGRAPSMAASSLWGSFGPVLQTLGSAQLHSHSSAAQHATPWHRRQQRPGFPLHSQALVYGRLARS